MKIFAVFKEGAYRHECGGIFSTLDKAKDAALVLITNEPDHHHTYAIVPFDLDVRTPQQSDTDANTDTDTESYKLSNWFSGIGAVLEPEAICTYMRKQGIVHISEKESS